MNKLISYAASFTAVALISASAVAHASEHSDSGGGGNDSYSTRFNFTAMGGFDFSSANTDLSSSWSHQTAQSPFVMASFQYAFLSQHPFNLLLGAQAMYIHGVEKLSSSLASSTFVTDEGVLEPVIGLGWNIGGAEGRSHLIFNLGLGAYAHDAELHSPGFNTEIKETNETDFHITGSAIYMFSLTESWRVGGGLYLTNAGDNIAVGASYGF